MRTSLLTDLVTQGLYVATGIGGTGTLIGSLAWLGWPFELASHFRVQYAWLLLVGVGPLLMTHHVFMATCAIGGGLVNLSSIAPLYHGSDKHGSRKPERTHRALLANVLSSNRAYDRLQRAIRDADPDIVVLTEVTEAWLSALKPLEVAYPFGKVVVLEGGFGICVLSRMPFERAEVLCIGGVGLPSIVVRVPLDAAHVTFVATHPLAPITRSHARRRNQQLGALAEFAQQEPGPLMLLGDLNTTSWSPVFQAVIRRARLQDSRIGFGVQPTWSLATGLLRIPLDHCLVSSTIRVHHRRVGPDIGSDHYPVIIDFSNEMDTESMTRSQGASREEDR